MFWFGNNQGNPVTDFYPRFWNALEPLGYRLHWGKFLPPPDPSSPDRLTSRYPHWDKWNAVRARVDPGGLFLTEVLAGAPGVGVTAWLFTAADPAPFAMAPQGALRCRAWPPVQSHAESFSRPRRRRPRRRRSCPFRRGPPRPCSARQHRRQRPGVQRHRVIRQTPGFDLVAVADVDLAGSSRFSSGFPTVRVYQDWRELLDERNTPTSTP